MLVLLFTLHLMLKRPAESVCDRGEDGARIDGTVVGVVDVPRGVEDLGTGECDRKLGAGVGDLGAVEPCRELGGAGQNVKERP